MTGTLRPTASSAIGRTMMPSGSCHLRSTKAGTASADASNKRLIVTASAGGSAGRLLPMLKWRIVGNNFSLHVKLVQMK
jgi:hypothetical protein